VNALIFTFALSFSVNALLAACREHNITSIVDGAHAVGQIPLQLDALDADFYTSNGTSRSF
jgi:selenocysteine lyase/cysteine desulfurase